MDGSVSFLTHPADPEWLLYGVVILAYWARRFWSAIRLSRMEALLIAKWPSQSARIHQICTFVLQRRFSNVGKITYLLVFVWGWFMVAMAYATDTSIDHITFQILLTLTFFSGAFFGIHMAINSRFINTVLVLEAARKSKISDPPKYEEMERVETKFIGGIFAAASLFALSCQLFSFPLSLYHLITMLDK